MLHSKKMDRFDKMEVDFFAVEVIDRIKKQADRLKACIRAIRRFPDIDADADDVVSQVGGIHFASNDIGNVVWKVTDAMFGRKKPFGSISDFLVVDGCSLAAWECVCDAAEYFARLAAQDLRDLGEGSKYRDEHDESSLFYAASEMENMADVIVKCRNKIMNRRYIEG